MRGDSGKVSEYQAKKAQQDILKVRSNSGKVSAFRVHSENKNKEQNLATLPQEVSEFDSLHDTKGNDGSCYYLLVDPRPGEAPRLRIRHISAVHRYRAFHCTLPQRDV